MKFKDLKVGMIFKDCDGDYCKVTDIDEDELYFEYSDDLDIIKDGDYDDTDSMYNEDFNDMDSRGDITIIKSMLSWKERMGG